jgi:hypothetical protein
MNIYLKFQAYLFEKGCLHGKFSAFFTSHMYENLQGADVGSKEKGLPFGRPFSPREGEVVIYSFINL